VHKYTREHSIIGSNFIEFQKVKHKFKCFYTKTIVGTDKFFIHELIEMIIFTNLVFNT